ncbi:Plexin-D1 like [Quillaja saponaria]|uniref:Plexin-D1 like n=1 Tax=Quillaja saponaria TaxID=32244 RepID=A0AAD7KU44_QUISA|nr:Plexin-D1 like [Quillaja saponaria]
MASPVSNFSYHRLRNEGGFDEEIETSIRAFKKYRNWFKIRRLAGRRRPKVQIPKLRKFLNPKRTKFVSKLKVTLCKALERLKNGQSHMNDLFGGNYLFMQVNPTPFRCATVQKPYLGHGLNGMQATKYSVGRI